MELKLVKTIDIGETVICDSCNGDYSNSEEQGGFIFCSWGFCPMCAPRMLITIKNYREERYIEAFCPRGMSYKDFILQARGGNNEIKFYEGI